MILGDTAYFLQNINKITAEFNAVWSVRHNALSTYINEKCKPIKLGKIIRRLCGEELFNEELGKRN